ncbi:MAG: AMP-binding protein [Acidobacteriota bacterium]|nr:AMP-binding protein [Acidobacteriota bacterium]
MNAPRTLPRLFETSVERYPDNVLMWEKKADKYEGTTFAQMKPLVHRFAAGLMSLGLEKGDRVALISEGRNDWVIGELGLFYVGAVDVPISVKLDERADLKFRLLHSGCRMALVSQNHIGKIRQVKPDLPDLKLTICFDGLKSFEADEISAATVLKKGEDFLGHSRAAFEARWQSVREDDPANICYTSGTTADPKGIVLTHRNYTANIEQGTALIDPQPDWVLLNVLPWDHAFGHTCGLYMMMKSGASIASVAQGKTALETLRNVPLNIKELRPHVFLSVPALAKNFRKTIEKGIRDKGPKIEALFAKAMKTAYAYNKEGWNRGRGAQKLKAPVMALYDKLLFSKIRENFGGRLKFFVGGGALLDIELQRFFYAVGFPMLQGYGLTEAAPVISANSLTHHKLGSSGRVMPNLEIRICDSDGNSLPTGASGEIVVRGENVMAGYWRNEKATAEALRGGWLYTGDLGYLDADGYLYVLGRVKSLLIANDGEKYSPELIEEAITDNSPYIEQLMLYNDQSPYTVGLLVPVKEAVLGWLKKKGLSVKTAEGQDAVLRLLESEVAKYKEGGEFAGQFPGRWLPATIAVLGEPFSEQNHLLNSTMKMVRSKIEDYYRNRIEYLFTPEAKSILNEQNRAIVERFE